MENKITFELNEPFELDYVKQLTSKSPNSNILIEIQNTRGITSNQIKQLDPNVKIRIAGGYDKDRVERNKDVVFQSGATGQYYVDAVTYTRNETIKILEAIEKIEKRIHSNWSDFQKLIYVHDTLIKNIMYDPNYEKKSSNETRSLRCLISKQTVCAGYSLVFKEIMDRNDIECEYVEGKGANTAHAWNIITINDRKYGIDLTWNNARFRSGEFNYHELLGQDIKQFIKNHTPYEEEKTQNYKENLSQMPSGLIQKISNQLERVQTSYDIATYCGIREDGSRYVLYQIGHNNIYNQDYYRYYYADLLNDGSTSSPLILYSELNVLEHIKQLHYEFKNDKQTRDILKNLFDNIVFSKENIKDTINKETCYIGNHIKYTRDNNLEFVNHPSEIKKSREQIKLFSYPTKQFKRSDGTLFVAQKMPKKVKLNGINLNQYDIFEIITENGKKALKKDVVFTEKDFFQDERQITIDKYLSRARIDRKNKETGGYIGYFDEHGIIKYYPSLIPYFETTKKIDSYNKGR